MMFSQIASTQLYKVPLLILSICAVTACQTIDPYTGEQKVNKASTYGAIGAVVCGIIGSRESSKRARNAALGCGAIGAGIGAYMDAQESALRRELQGSGVQVRRIGNDIELIMPGNITFATDEYAIRSDFYPVLDSVAKVLAKFIDTSLDVEGHTDSTGSLNYNLVLSENRAKSVADYLASRNVSYSRLVTYGRGPSQPIADNASPRGREQNRRVELRIVPIS